MLPTVVVAAAANLVKAVMLVALAGLVDTVKTLFNIVKTSRFIFISKALQ